MLLNGLRRLEYRGYDSAGMAVFCDGQIKKIKAVGKIDNLAAAMKNQEFSGNIGIAHTRWATHGGITEANAHPHTGCNDDLVIVHNGIIENYRELKEKFLSGHEIKSETDTEILAHLIEVFYAGNLRLAIAKALSEVRGTYGLVAMHKNEPGKLIAARFGSPIAIGVGKDEYFIASDTSPMLAYTQNVIFLDDKEIAEIGENIFQIFTLKNQAVNKTIEKIDWNEEQAERGGFPHFMLKEIFDQPMVLEDAIRGRYDLADGTAHLGGLNMTISQMHSMKRIILIACGTAYYAAMAGKNAFERLAGIPAQVEIASEFRYSEPILDKRTLVFGISQSGETADTLAALREAKRRGAFVRGIVNVVGSTIARETDGGTYIHAGPELSVASTKAYTNMIAVLFLYALQFGRLNRVSAATGSIFLRALMDIPLKMNLILEKSEEIKRIAEKFKNYKNFYYLGRGVNLPCALEGSLKLKEITYIHSEGYAGGEMKHGPIALLSPDFPIFAIMTQNQLYDKMKSNVEEARAHRAPLIILATEGDASAKEFTDDVIYVPQTAEVLEPLLNNVPLQLFAYHMAVALDRDVDRPRNLAKSVTVE